MKKVFTLFVLLLAMIGSAMATEIWTGSCTIGNWSGSNVTVENTAFSSATAGDIIKVTFSNYYDGTYTYKENNVEMEGTVTYWQYNLGQEGNSWVELTGFSDGNLAKGQKSASYILTSTNVTELKTYGLAVNGRFVTVTKVELLTITETVSLFSGSTGTGNWANDVTWSSDDDKAKLAAIQLNDYVRMTYTVTASDAQAAIQAAWTSVAAKDDNSYVSEGVNTGKTLTLTIDDATTLEKIQQNNIQVRGKNITITAVDHLKASNRYDAVPLTIGEDGVVSFGSSKSLDFSGVSDVTPYYVNELGTNCVYLKSVNTTRAWAGYIVQGTVGTYNIPVTDSEPAWINAFHYLRYSGDYNGNWVYRSAYSDYSDGDDTNNESTTTDEYKIKNYFRYIFAKDDEGIIGFYRLAPTYSREINVEATPNTVYYHILNAHKAYLETPSDITTNSETGAPMIHLVFDEENNTTNVEDIRADEEVYKFFQNGHLLITRGGIMYDAMGRIINKH